MRAPMCRGGSGCPETVRSMPGIPLARSSHFLSRLLRRRSLPALTPLLLALIFTSFAQPLLSSRPAAAASAPANLHVVGNQLVDANDKLVRLLGVNRSGTEYACAQGWGLFDGPSDLASVQAIAAWRANAVRVPLNE